MITVGVDEVGRGCWAGPLVAGAVILDEQIVGLKDSKKLSKKQREILAAEIQLQALALGLGWVQPAEIDSIGITAAVKLAMERALAEIGQEYDELIIDGSFNFFPENYKSKAIVRADDSVPSVSAASIVAKVARDKYMCELGGNYVDYQFARHVGYGTALHIELLQKYGVSDMHRKSYKPIQALLVQ
ncbi:MAG TPA: ribonuclease HII [Candidatus Saccharimonadales bacterium]|nr:ribonuclease HII [Candidatus Saccharimonadales bacterium]